MMDELFSALLWLLVIVLLSAVLAFFINGFRNANKKTILLIKRFTVIVFAVFVSYYFYLFAIMIIDRKVMMDTGVLFSILVMHLAVLLLPINILWRFPKKVNISIIIFLILAAIYDFIFNDFEAARSIFISNLLFYNLISISNLLFYNLISFSLFLYIYNRIVSMTLVGINEERAKKGKKVLKTKMVSVVGAFLIFMGALLLPIPILPYLILIPFPQITFPDIVFGLSNTGSKEIYDFTPEEAYQIVLEHSQEREIPFAKNIGLAYLPHLHRGRTDDNGSANSQILGSDISECGKTCEDLIQSGYADGFLDYKTGFKIRDEKIARYYHKTYKPNEYFDDFKYSSGPIDKKSRSKDYVYCEAFIRINRSYFIFMNKRYYMKICTLYGTFFYAMIYKMVPEGSKGSNLLSRAYSYYSIRFGDEFVRSSSRELFGAYHYTVEGLVTWYQFYDWMNKEKR